MDAASGKIRTRFELVTEIYKAMLKAAPLPPQNGADK
jgi:hypothetical protein